MNAHTCSHCSAQIQAGAYLCSKCTKTLRIAAVHTGEHYADLEILRTHRKATRYDLGGGKGGRKEQPLGVDLRFVHAARDEAGRLVEGQGTELEHETRNTAVTWARVVLEEWPSLTAPADNVPAVCAFLAGVANAVAGQPWSGDMLTELLALERRLSALVDVAPTRWYAGRCGNSDELVNEDGTTTTTVECTAELYAIEDATVIVCPACRTEHDVKGRRDVLLAEAGSYHVTASEAAGALVAWTDLADNETKLADRIRKWGDRGVLEVLGHTGVNGKDRRLYRLGDIQDRLVETVQREQATRLRKRGA